MKNVLRFFVVFSLLGTVFTINVFAEGGQDFVDGYNMGRDFMDQILDSPSRSSPSSSQSNPSLIEGRYYPTTTSEAYIDVTRNGNEYYFEIFILDRGNWLNPFDTAGVSSANAVPVYVVYVNQSHCSALGISTTKDAYVGVYTMVNTTSFSDTSGTVWRRR